MLTVAQTISKRLKEQGINTAFGVTGSHYIALLQVMEEENIKFYSVKHETSAGFMALHYARASQKPAMCLGTAGPGILNLVNGTAELYKSQIPAFIISPMISTREFGKNGFQEDTGLGTTYSINELLSTITKKSLQLNTPDEINSTLDALIQEMFTLPMGPVHLSVPANYFEQSVKANTKDSIDTSILSLAKVPEDELIEKASSVISHSKSPLLLIGLRALFPDLGSEINKFMESCSIPVVTSFTTKGIVNEHHDLWRGVLDLFGHKSAEYFIKHSDCVISLGYDFGSSNTLKYDPDLIHDKLIQIDSIPHDINRVYKTNLSIVGPLDIVLTKLRQQLSKQEYKALVPDERKREHQEREKINRYLLEEASPISNPLKPQSVYSIIQQEINKQDYLITADIGASNWWATRYLKVKDHSFQTFCTGYSMGQGVGGVVGAKIAKPNKLVISLCGDGAFLMQGNEILTAKQYQLGIIFIVFVDNRFNLVSMNKKLTYGDDTGYSTAFDGPDYSLLSQAYKIPGTYVKTEKELRESLQEYIQITLSEKPQPCLLAIAHDSDEFLPIKSQTIGMIEDFQETTNIKNNSFLMQAFRSCLKERIFLNNKIT